jgi:hypothetical protein
MTYAKPALQTALTEAVRSGCIAYLERHGMTVTDPRDPVSLAQAMLVCIGGAEHAIHGEAHALRLVKTFYRSRVNPQWQAQQPTAPTKRQRRELARARRRCRSKTTLDREHERIMGPIMS